MKMKSEHGEQAGKHQGNDDLADNVSRVEEQGEASAPNAPTDAEENEGMSTVLDAEPMTGVQDDEGEA